MFINKYLHGEKNVNLQIYTAQLINFVSFCFMCVSVYVSVYVGTQNHNFVCI